MSDHERTIEAGIVGCGGIAQVFHIPILHKNPNAHIQAVCDLDTSKAAILAEKYNISHIFQDIADMLQNVELDVLFILTPTNMHLPMALMALDFGLNLFIEKPAAHTVGDVERIRDRAADKNLAVMVGMHNRFREDLRTIRGFLDEEELGKLYLIKTGWLQAKHQAIKQSWVFQKNVSGGGVILDLGVQVIDTLLWMLHETTPKNVKAISFNMNEALKVEDFCAACITFENNLSLLIEVSWDFPILKDRVYLEIVGEKGTGTLSPLRLQKLWHGQLVNIAPEIHGNRMLHFKQGYENEVNHLIDFLLGREKKLESSIEDAIQVHKIIDKIYESAREGHEVSVE